MGIDRIEKMANIYLLAFWWDIIFLQVKVLQKLR